MKGEEEERSRLIANVRAYVCVVAIGTILIICGTVFIVYKDAQLFFNGNKQSSNLNVATTQQNAQDTQISFEPAAYEVGLRVTGFVLLGLGTICLGFGLCMIFHYWRRFQILEESERYPMLSPRFHEFQKKFYAISNKKRKNLVTGKLQPYEHQSSSSGKEDSKSLVREKRKHWFRKADAYVSDDSFRIAAHHHPSFNLVPIEGLAALYRVQSFPADISASNESEEKESLHLSENGETRTKKKFAAFFRAPFFKIHKKHKDSDAESEKSSESKDKIQTETVRVSRNTI